MTHPGTYRGLDLSLEPTAVLSAVSTADDAAEADFVADYGAAQVVAGRGELWLEVLAANAAATATVIVQGYNEDGVWVGSEARTITLGARSTRDSKYFSDIERFDIAAYYAIRVKLDAVTNGPIDVYAGSTP